MAARSVSTGARKLHASRHIRQLAKDVEDHFPEMQLHQHLHDAARELDAGRVHSAQRHLNAAMFGLQPQQVRRHGVHDDGGHETAKSHMQRAYRGLLLVKDIEDIGTSNDELTQQRRETAMQAAQDRADRAGRASQMSWDDHLRAIELGTFAGKPPGSGANFAKLKSTLAARGARNPGALAGWIGRRKYGRKRMGHFSAMGRARAAHAHANAYDGTVIELKRDVSRERRDDQGRWTGGGSITGPSRHGSSSGPFGGKKLGRKQRAALVQVFSGGKKGKKMPKAEAALRRRREKSLRRSQAPVGGLAAAFGAANPAGGIELVGPKGYVHNWKFVGIPGRPKTYRPAGGRRGPLLGQGVPGSKAQRSARPRRAVGGLGATMDQPGFAALAPSQKAAYKHLRSRGHSHEKAMKAVKRYVAKGVQSYGRSVAGAPRIGLYANPGAAPFPVELVGPKGYVHNWKYVGGPGLPAPKARPGRFFYEGRQVSRREYQQRMNENAGLGVGPGNIPQKQPFPKAGLPKLPSPGQPLSSIPGQAERLAAETGPRRLPGGGYLRLEGGPRPDSGRRLEKVPPLRRVGGWVSGAPAARLNGEIVHGDLGGGRGTVTGRYSHRNSTVTTHDGKVHRVQAIDAQAHEAGFKGDIASSHLPVSVKAGLLAYNRNYRSGAVTKRIKKGLLRQAGGAQVAARLAGDRDALELAGPYRYRHGWIKLLQAGSATEAAAKGAGLPLETSRERFIRKSRQRNSRKAYKAARARGLSHPQAMKVLRGLGRALNAGSATRSITQYANPTEPPPFASSG